MSAVCVLRTRCSPRTGLPGLPAAMRRRYSLDVPAPLLRTQAYVGGRWVSAASVFPVLDPATGQEVARVSDCGPTEAKQAVDAAHKAFQSWKQNTAKVGRNLRVCQTRLHSKICPINTVVTNSIRKQTQTKKN